MRADARGRPLWFLVTPGQTGDILAAPVLLESQQDEAVLAEKADDSNARGDRFTVMGAARTSRQTECEQLRGSAAINRLFDRRKHFRRFATRSER